MKISVPAPSAGTRVRCFCGDCQTAARLHDPDQDILTPAGGSDIWHTTPDRISIVAGAETLKISRLSPRGAYRWYAGCCGTLMLSTAKNLKLPFVSMPLRQPELAVAKPMLGPVRCLAFAASARDHPDAPARNKGVYSTAARGILRAARAWLGGRAKNSPLRQSDGAPIAPVEVITLETRKAAKPDHLT